MAEHLIASGEQVLVVNSSVSAYVPPGVKLTAGDAFDIDFVTDAVRCAAVVDR